MTTSRPRPLSPHLQIYRFTITMTMSIVHRGTGMALYVGTLLLVIWLGAAALGEGPLGVVNMVFGSWFGQIVLFLATWALFHHMLGGVRHFIWDSIHGLEPGQREALAWANLIGSIVLTLVVWAVFVWFRG
jgi:succinate dehydrogenase / fumarate reductase cytochrome b subunit